MNPIIRLVYRNLTISINPGFIIWQILFPLIYIFVAGFAYTSLIENVPFGNKDLELSCISGIWYDRIQHNE